MAGDRRHHTRLEFCAAHPATPLAAPWSAGRPNPIIAANPSLRRLGLWPALALALLAFLGVTALETFSIDPGRPAAIIFSDAVSADQAFAQLLVAGGLPLRPARSALGEGPVWIAAAGSPDFFERVKAAGAWVINPFAFGGCFLVKPA